MSKYNEFWSKVIEQVIRRIDPLIENMFDIPVPELSELGDRKASGFNGRIFINAGHIDDFTESAVFKSLANEISKIENLKEKLPGFLRLRVYGNALLKVHYKPTSEKAAITNNNESPNKTDMKDSLNTILYGPPGTGKTYQTIDKAMGILGYDVKEVDRKTLKANFDKFIEAGRIIFTTFHQSMSYEDFIEGIKPIMFENDEDRQVQYEIIPGIFKKACALAAYNCYTLYTRTKQSSNQYSFDDLYYDFVTSIRAKLENNEMSVFRTLRGREVEIKKVNSNDSIIASAKGSMASHVAPLTKENLQKLYDKYRSIDEIKDLQQVRDAVGVSPRTTEFYAIFKGLKEFEKLYAPDIQFIAEEKESQSLDIEEILKKFSAGVYNDAVKADSNSANPIVLIIDEINRGNIAQIFGELITLIEEDKRAGREEALTAILPYSKKSFSVPSNLYIIGTMNTADRSVEALDTALRRRFAFEEINSRPDLLSPQRMIWKLWWDYPHVAWIDEPYKSKETKMHELLGIKEDFDPDEKIWNTMKKEGISESQISYFDAVPFSGINLEKLLNKINMRLTALLNKDHTIGHAWLMNVYSIEDLQTAFKNKILPLLQEFFYNDYAKIGLVLGDTFLTQQKVNKGLFAKFKDENELAAEYEDKVIYALKDPFDLKLEDFKSIYE